MKSAVKESGSAPGDDVRREQVEEALQLLEEKFFKAFHGNPNPTLISRQDDGMILEANEAFGRWFGMAVEKIRGKTSFDFGLWKSDAERQSLIQLLKAKGSISNYEKLIPLPSGETRVTLLSIQPLIVQGEHCLLTISTDITQQKNAEKALQQSEERLRRALDAAGMGTWELDLLTNRVVWSDGVHRLFGLAPGDFGGTFAAFLDMVEPKDREVVQRNIADALEGRSPEYYSEMRIRWADGTVRWVEGRGEVQRDASGKPVKMVGTVVDITERKGAEFALRESEERFRSLADSAFEGIGITDGYRVVDVNDQMAEMLGYDRHELIGRPVRDLVAPESLGLVEEMIRAGNEGPYEHLALRKNGSVFPVEVHAKALPSSNRKLRVTSIRDITERRRAEAALRSSEERLRATVENTPHVAVQWYDTEGRVLFWNQASEVLYGWTAAEAAGRTLDELIFGPAEAAMFLDVLAHIKRSGEPAGPTEFPFHRRDGSEGICLSTVFQIPFAVDKSCFVCMDVDLTERKRAEKSLREAQARQLRDQEEFARQLLSAQEQERQRIANELHDSLGQNLSLIKNNAHLALKQPGLPSPAVDRIEAISRYVSEAINEVRSLAQNLRPLQIEQLGLTDSLDELIRRVAQSTPIRIERRLEKVDDVFTSEAATHVYRILQEALNNLIRHSGADYANITLERDVRCVRLRVLDNGGGFEVKKVASKSGLGLTSIGERARMLGGSLRIHSVTGEGTRLMIELPVPDAVAGEAATPVVEGVEI